MVASLTVIYFNYIFSCTQFAQAFSYILLFSKQAAYTNSLPNTLLAANGHPVRESDLSYSPFPINQSTSTKYGSSASSIGGSTISMAEV